MTTRNLRKLNEQINSSPMSSTVAQLIESKLNEHKEHFATQLKLMEDRICERFGAIVADLANIRSDLKKLCTKVTDLDKRVDNINFDMDKLRTTVSSLESEKVASDVVIFNIPNEIDAVVAVKKLVNAIASDSIQVCNAFRSHSTNNAKAIIPIIAKLSSPNDRVKFFRALAEFRNKNKRQVQLRDFGFSGENAVNVHECISSANRELLRSALHYKKSQLLNSVFTLRGSVYIRKKADDKATKILKYNDLEKIVGGT